ncbi:MAG TPA: bifunctional glycosyltransferase/class I SAM-dependent methyltransferase [Polyangiaceae bacterium]|jgi:SAM-dependent methyltransferase|nr:bifunctional glycosyltransferase/class I SAM-dependent methyltransferase [Polyangiaceae bacterium]
MPPRIALLIVQVGTAESLEQVWSRVPESVRPQVAEVMIFDGSTQRDAGWVKSEQSLLQAETELSVFRGGGDLGRGGAQILGFKRAIARGYDIVVVLRGDGHDAPEALPELLSPLESGAADAVFGSQVLRGGGFSHGATALEAFGDRALSRFESLMLGTSLSELNPGYRLYARRALERVPFEKNSRRAQFDTQIIIQLRGAGLRILEKPVAVQERAERGLSSGLQYAAQVLKSVVDYELHEFGLRHHPEYVVPPAHTMKHGALSSHSQLLELVGFEPRRILDIGCGPGELGHVLRERGHYVFGVDWSPPRFALDAFVQADISHGLPSSIDGNFDIVLLADVLEHMIEPMKLLLAAKQRLSPGGSLLVSLPNAVHWSMRAQLAAGRFDYTNKGLLDRGHLRFFTRNSALRMFRDAGLEVRTSRSTPVPWENVLPRALGSTVRDKAEKVDHFLTRLRPNLFAYQHLFQLRVAAPAGS